MFWLKYLNITIIGVILLNSLIGQTIVAQTRGLKPKIEYKPPKGRAQHPTQTRKAGGARGKNCNLSSNNTVTLLVPQDHVPTTVSERPTFFWYLPESLPLRFTLIEPGKKPIFVSELTPEPGISALKLPQNYPPLEIGKTYRWTVTVVCSANKPSKNAYAWALIKRVPPVMKPEIESERDFIATIELAAEGIWYDALLSGYQQNPETTAFRDLLEQVNLGYIE